MITGLQQCDKERNEKIAAKLQEWQDLIRSGQIAITYGRSEVTPISADGFSKVVIVLEAKRL